MVKKILIGIGLTLFPLISAFSEVELDATLIGAVTANMVGDDVTSSGMASGNLTIKSSGLKEVKSQLTLDFASIRNLGILSISKAWIKFRYPLLRVTLGKNRITWGEGAAFNAGDVIFDDYIALGGESESVDLTADELKSLNRTMAQVIFPMGRFTYAEAIYLPYDFPLYIEIPTTYYNDAGDEDGTINTTTPDYTSEIELYRHSGGGRFVTKAGGIKLETGYIYNGYSSLHKPYISINGTLGIDYHLSSSINIKHGETDFEDWKDTLNISAGSFYLFDLDNDKTLTLRLEALVKPFGDWNADALLLYPEISFVPNEEIALFLRSIMNPIDLDFKSTLGLNWKTYQGFSIGSFYTLNVVQDEDTEHSLSVVVTHKF